MISKQIDFLNSFEDMYETTKLGYFENDGRDLSIAIKFDEEICVLLANGYS